jgi:hypothetical protein
MFIRWQRRYREKDGNNRWTAILAESRRVNGKPRQHHIATLGSITLPIAYRPVGDVDDRCAFWERASARLDRLGNQVSAADREHVEASLEDRVRRPLAAEYLKAAQLAAIMLNGAHYLSAEAQAALRTGKAPRFCR